MTTRLALIGFGEAAQAMSLGFKDEAGTAVSAYDIRFRETVQSATLKAQADELGVRAALSPQEAVANAEVVLSLVTGSVAVKVAEEVAPHLKAGQTYVDLNSVSPETKVKVGEVVASAGTGARYVEGAIMDAVRPRRHQVPILLAGPNAEATAAALNGVGMKCEVAGETIGQACAVKMIRSVMIKGVEALILESMTAAERAGVTERILDSVNETFAGLDWRKLSSHHLRRVHEHGARRSGELKESAATLRGLGMEAVLATAVSEALAAGHARLGAIPYDPKVEYPALLRVLARPA